MATKIASTKRCVHGTAPTGSSSTTSSAGCSTRSSAGVRFTFVSDSCHSGTVTRALPAFLAPDKRRVRFLNPRLLGLPELRSVLDQRAGSKNAGRPESVMREVLVAGCRDIQYSYDAKIGPRYHGAMTYYVLQALEHARSERDLQGVDAAVEALLRDNGYDQSPQLEGRSDAKGAEGVPVNELVVLGTVLTVDHDRRTHGRGAVYIHDGRIEQVADESQPAPAGYDDAPRGRVRRCRRTRPDRSAQPPRVQHVAALGRARRCLRHVLPMAAAASYGPDVSNPSQALGIAAPAAALRFAEVKAAVGGVTSIQGSPPLTPRLPRLDGAQRRERSSGKVSRSSNRCCPPPTSSWTQPRPA